MLIGTKLLQFVQHCDQRRSYPFLLRRSTYAFYAVQPVRTRDRDKDQLVDATRTEATALQSVLSNSHHRY